MNFQFVILSLGIGALTGFLSGLLGIGGGAVLTPFIRIVLNQPAYIALGTTVPVILPTAVSGAYGYYRSKKLDYKVIKFSGPAAFVFSIAGSYSTKFIDGSYLMIFTAVVILVLSIRMLFPGREGDIFKYFKKGSRNLNAFLIGSVAGYLAGLLGIGGGFILVPAFYFLLNMEPREAFGNSLAVIFFGALPSMFVHGALNHIDWLISLLVILAVVPFSYIGSRVSIRLKSQNARIIFGTIMFFIGAYFMLSEIFQI